MPATHCTDWKAIDVERARTALARGGTLFALPCSFYRGGGVYRQGLSTKRGTCYLVSDYVLRGLAPTLDSPQPAADFQATGLGVPESASRPSGPSRAGEDESHA